MTRFPPTAPSLAFSSPTASESESATPATVFVPTLLTRPLYSQLVLQRFFPPKVFERVGWMDGAKVGSEEERRRSVGMKIVRCRCLPLSPAHLLLTFLLECSQLTHVYARLRMYRPADSKCCTVRPRRFYEPQPSLIHSSRDIVHSWRNSALADILKVR